ncbi:MAG: tetratricopeptide repeat protein, partial [Patescibacteria group bacterium]
AYTNLADLYKNKLNQPEKIDPLIMVGLDKTGGDPTLHAYLGGYYRDVKNYPKAIEHYEHVLKVRPDETTVWEEVERLKAKMNQNP